VNDCAYLWMFAFEGWKQARHQPSARCSNNAEASVAFNFGIRRLNIGLDVFEFMDNSPSSFHNNFSVVSELSAGAFNKADPKLFFKA